MSEPADVQHYFSEVPGARSAERTVRLVLPDLRLDLVTDRGTFAPGGVDAGTKLLLLDAPHPPAGASTIVDVGTGYGPIALTLARRCPTADVWAVDVNERALALCRRNAAAAGLGNVIVARPQDVPTDLRADAIYSNPPIRIGKAALHGLLDLWRRRLAPGAAMTLVVHRHLGADSLQRWLAAPGPDDEEAGRGGEDQGRYHVERLSSRAGYRLLEVARAP